MFHGRVLLREAKSKPAFFSRSRSVNGNAGRILLVLGIFFPEKRSRKTESKQDETEKSRRSRWTSFGLLLLLSLSVCGSFQLAFFNALSPNLQRLSLRGNALTDSCLPFFLALKKDPGSGDSSAETGRNAEEVACKKEAKEEKEESTSVKEIENKTFRPTFSSSSSSANDLDGGERRGKKREEEEMEEGKEKKSGGRCFSEALFPHLRWLDLSENELSSWRSFLSNFVYFPNLDTLCILNNRLPGVRTPEPLPRSAEAEKGEESSEESKKKADESEEEEKKKKGRSGEDEEKVCRADVGVWDRFSSYLSLERRSKVIELCFEDNQIDTW